MGDSFTFGTTYFVTGDTVRYRKYALERRRAILARKTANEQAQEEETVQELPQLQDVLPRSVSISLAYRGDLQEEVEPTKKMGTCSPGPRRWAYMNLYGVSIAYMLIYSAFFGLQNLQSSLNAELGLASLATTYSFYFLIGFATPAIVRPLGTKYAILFGFICHTIYIASNFYPEYYTLIPASVLLGIGSGPIWAGLSKHVATTAITYAPHITESIDIVISRFTATFFFLYKSAQFSGNVVSSLVLFPYGESKNDTTPDVCDNTEASDIDKKFKYILLGIYLAFDIAGLTILLIFVSKLPKDLGFSSKGTFVQRYCSRPFIDLLKVMFSWKMLLLGPFSLYNGLELSFTFGTFTREYISECVGVSKVGFALIAFGVFGAGVSFFYGKIVKYIPRVVLTTAAALINLFFYLFLLFWSREASYELIFLYAIFWGLADGIQTTATASLAGILYPNDQEAAFSVFRIWMSFGYAMGFIIPEIFSEIDHIFLTALCVLVVTFTLYVLLEFFLSRFGAKCCEKEKLMEIDEGLTESMLRNRGKGVFSEPAAVESDDYALYSDI